VILNLRLYPCWPNTEAETVIIKNKSVTVNLIFFITGANFWNLSLEFNGN